MSPKLIEKIKSYRDKKKYTKLKRQINEEHIEYSSGYIIDYSKKFILLQETDDFRILGYNIFPIDQIVELRHNLLW